ncbi:MAG: hypothetical protein HYX68_06750 [Planctomycetes bacterium]|nr:hypothetical protein [Planctomycetota bacterium]
MSKKSVSTAGKVPNKTAPATPKPKVPAAVKAPQVGFIIYLPQHKPTK